MPLRRNMASRKMAKELRHTMKPWIEVAPPLFDHFPLKYSNPPKLATIKEEKAGEFDDDDDDE